MNHQMRCVVRGVLACALLVGVTGQGLAEDSFLEKVKRGFPHKFGALHMNAPDGRRISWKGPTRQPDLSPYRSPLESKILDRRWYTNPGFYLANEEMLTSEGLTLDAVKAGFPVAHDPQLWWISAQEGYWYSRYALNGAQAKAHMGVCLVQGPYWTLKARQLYEKNRLNRDRGERVPSNKDILLGRYLPLYYQRVGLPRVFDDACPTYLDYASGDPHLIGPTTFEDTFDDPQSDKKFGWGVPGYLLDFANARWNRDTIDTTIDMGALAQTLKKKIIWTHYFFHSDHIEASPADPTVETTLLGNDSEEGFRGVALILGAWNTILEMKAALFADPKGKTLAGINPYAYDPAQGFRYLPHQIAPNLVLLGDLPERVWALDIKDSSSQLWDQAAMLWATADFYYTTYRFKDRVFTANPPIDGGILEFKSRLTARGIANVLVKNLEAMHRKNGILTSTWTPDQGVGDRVSVKDSMMAVVGLKEYVDRLEWGDDPEPALREKALNMLTAQADFLLRVQGADGSFAEAYRVPTGEPIGEATLMAPQFWAIRALVAAYHVTEEWKYVQAARRTWNLLNKQYWHEPSGLYRSRLGDDTVVYTPWEIGAAVGAMREFFFTVSLDRLKPMLERFKRFWVQALDNSGRQMAEDFNTGELSFGIVSHDEDQDGIPHFAWGDGTYGISPVSAFRVAINIGGAGNRPFSELEGDPYQRPSYVEMKYVSLSADEQRAVLLPLTETPGKGKLVEREPIERFSGSIVPLPPTREVARGSEHSGAEIYRLNCAICHGDRGEGIMGKSLKKISASPREEIEAVPMAGRFEKGMPPWGAGGVLTKAEIDRVVDYIKNELFKEAKTKTARAEQDGENRTARTDARALIDPARTAAHEKR